MCANITFLFPVILRPQTYPLVILAQCQVSIAFLFLENLRHTKNGRTDERVQHLMPLPSPLRRHTILMLNYYASATCKRLFLSKGAYCQQQAKHVTYWLVVSLWWTIL